MRSLRELGKTIFLTTHFMDEAQTLADRVAVMRSGSIVALGPPNELGGRDVRPTTIRFVLPAGRSAAELPGAPSPRALGRGRPRRDPDRPSPWRRRRASRRGRVEEGVELEHFSVTQPTLEDVYLELTGDQGSGDESGTPQS